MSSSPQDVDALDPRVNRALQDFLERMDRGEAVDPEQFLSEHGEIADQLRSFIADAADLARRATPNATPAAEVSTNRSLSETIPPSAPGATPALPEVFGRYRVLRLLGRGAMGAVYLADDTQLARQVALKIPHFDNDQSEELLQRFYREARTAATLRNPHICPVYDVGEIGGQHYISMAYIEGHPLSEIIKAKGAQPERQVLTLIRKLALALQEAHNQGVIHRDLKPGNVMVDARGEPVVTDFGLACQVREGAERLTHSGVILGSPAYMSPEQLEGSSAKITAAADQYALGVMLYELLTGQLPFRGTISAVVGQIITKPAPSPRLLRPELDPRVNDLCLQMLAKTADQRFASMKAVAERILAILKEPVKAEDAAKAKGSKADLPAMPSDGAAETIPPTGANQQQQIVALIQRGELQAALEVLEPLTKRKPGKLVDWAKHQAAEVRARLEKQKGEQSALCLLAGKLIRKTDYAEAIRILSAVPDGVRSEELSDLLADAEAKEEEAALLLKDIETAVRNDQPKELPTLVKRFLQLKPGNKAVQALAADLKQYGPERVIRLRRNQRDFLDVVGPTWNPIHAVYFIGGLLITCAAVYAAAIAFQTPNGTVIIEVHDPRVVVNFANDEITATSSGKTYRLKTTDKKTLQLEIDGVTVDGSTQEITVEQNETKIISARLVDGKLDLAINREKKTFAVPDAVHTKQTAGSEAKNTTERVGEWIDLVATADLATMKASNHEWTRNGTILTAKMLPPANYAWMAFVPPQEVKGDYDLEIDYLVVGTQHLQVGLPLNDTIVTLGVGGGAGTGLDWIDGLTAEANENNVPPHGNPDVQIKPGVVQHITASIRHNGDNVTVVTKLDDVETGKFSGLRSRLKTPIETVPKPGRIKLVSPIQGQNPDHRLEIHKARVRFITPVESSGTIEEGWTPLFTESTSSEWIVRDGILSLKSNPDKSKFYVNTTQSFSNFELRLEYRLLNEGYTGLRLRRSQREGSKKPGPLVNLGFLTVEGGKLMNATGDLFVRLAGVPTDLGKATTSQRETIEQADRSQKWNDMSIRCEGPRVIVEINGMRTADYTDTESKLSEEGQISIGGGLLGPDFRNIRVRELGPASPSKATPPETSSTVAASAKASKVLLDVDFRNSSGNFARGDYDHVLMDHKDSEYRYLGKKVGWWHGGVHSVFYEKENNQLRDFAMEVDIRLATTKRGSFAIEFGRVGDETRTLKLNQLGQVQIIGNNDVEIVPWTTSREMRPVSQFNTLRLSVENKLVKVSINGSPLFEKLLKRYTGGPVIPWLVPEETPFDVRLQRIRFERLSPDEAAQRTQEVRRFKGHTGTIRGVAYLPDGQKAVSVGHEKAFKLWEIATGKLLHDFAGHTDHVTSVSVSGDGKRALTGCWDKQVRLWDLEEHKLLKTLKGHVDKVVSVLLSRDGLSGLSLSNDGIIRRWDFKTGKSTVVPGPAPYGVLAINPAENVIASGNGDGTVVLRGAQGIAPLKGHDGGYVEGLAFTPDGSKLVTGGDDGTVRVWDLNTGKTLRKLETEGVGFDTVTITADGRYIVAGCGDQTIVSWDLLTGDKVATIHTDAPVTHRLALSPDNQFVLTGGGDIGWKPTGDFDLRLWRLPSPPSPTQPLTPLENAQLEPLIDADFSQGLHGFAYWSDKTGGAAHREGEWQYVSKIAGVWTIFGQPQFEKVDHDNFVFEAEARSVNPKAGGWGLRFSDVSAEQYTYFRVGHDRRVSITEHYDNADHITLAPTPASSMREPTVHNTVRLEVVRGVARIFINGQYVTQATLKKYQATPAMVYFFPDEAPLDVRFKRIRLWHVK